MDILLTIFWGIILLMVVVLIHEAGHYLAARMFGVRVSEFMMGLPGPNISFKRKTGKTRFGITCIPLGGYARICGMEGGEENPNLEKVLAYVYSHGNATPNEVAYSLGIEEDEAEETLVILEGWGSVVAPTRKEKKTGEFRYKAPSVYDKSQKSWLYEEGEARQVEDSTALLDSERSQTYRNIGLVKRLIILCAGVFNNFLLAMIIFVVILATTPTYETNNEIVDFTSPSAAQEAGVEIGDRIIRINGVSVEDGTSFTNAMANVTPGSDVSVTYTDGKTTHTSVITTTDSDGRATLGVYIGYNEVKRSFGEALTQAWEYPKLVFKAVVDLVNPVTAAQTISQSTSIVGISVVAKSAADTSMTSFWWLIAAVSLSLAFMNLLPIPPLDGGRIVIEVIEKIVGRPLSVKVINIVSLIGVALFLMLFVVLTYQDIFNFVIG